ncbi:MAG: autoinducer binding domain-containing protein [Pseudomonadota bacterium]
MTGQLEIEQKLVELKDYAPAGWALALHVHFTAATFILQTYDQKWRDYYTKNGLVMSDPIVKWGYENRGALFWDDLASEDAGGVLKAAADHGLGYGVVTSVGTEGGFSIGGFARNDRPYTDEEAEFLRGATQEIHDLTDNLKELSPETAEAMRRLAIEYTHPPSA